MTHMLQHPDATFSVEAASNGRRRVTVFPNDPKTFAPTRTWETRYPDTLLKATLDVKGPAYFLDEIRRDEDTGYVATVLLNVLEHYESSDRLARSRILDFGCGAGASTMILARRFPEAHITGVDLSERLLSLAETRKAHYRADRVRFLRSPTPTRIPEGIGPFDYVILSGVFEHLLPDERVELMPQLWERLAAGGILFVIDTPHRYWPVEAHTTGLPFLNYLPDALALTVSRRFSPRLRGTENWDGLLRAGIRGATPEAIARCLTIGDPAKPRLLEPTVMGLDSRVDLWLAISGGKRLKKTKRLVAGGLSLLRRLTGQTLLPSLELAFRKPGERDDRRPQAD